MEIQILGIGCARCEELEKRVRDTLAEQGIVAEIKHVTDLKQFGRTGDDLLEFFSRIKIDMIKQPKPVTQRR